MRKIDKTIHHAKEYEKWANNNPAAPYNSSNNPYYLDVLAELLIIQGGLCAYTEFRLVKQEALDALAEQFESGNLKAELGWNREIFVHLEHFDARKKKTSGWSWENFFAVWDSVNHKKRANESLHPVDPILKPDRTDYDPFELLDYNVERHIFIPNTTQPIDIQEKISNMILVLGLNLGTVWDQRKEYLEKQLQIAHFRGTAPEVHQFPTAFAFLQRKRS